jgi:hypothetical protein
MSEILANNNNNNNNNNNKHTEKKQNRVKIGCKLYFFKFSCGSNCSCVNAIGKRFG